MDSKARNTVQSNSAVLLKHHQSNTKPMRTDSLTMLWVTQSKH